MKKNISQLITLTLLGCLLFNCFQEEIDLSQKNDYREKINLIKQQKNLTKEDATKIALTLLKSKDTHVKIKTFNIKSNRDNCLAQSNSDTNLDKLDASKLFIINTEHDGFCVVAANRNINPILAFNQVGELKIDTSNYGLMGWFHEASNYAMGDNSLNIIDNHITPRISLIQNSTTYEYLYDSLVYRPTITYNWYQGGIYDKEIPSRRTLGCGPVAAGMVMRYYQYTNRVPDYNWLTITLDLPEKDDVIAQLLADLRRPLGTIKGVSYTATTTHDMIHTLHNWGYTAHRNDYDTDILFDEIKHGRPVLVQGMGHGAIYYFLKAHWFVISGKCMAVCKYTTTRTWYTERCIDENTCELVKLRSELYDEGKCSFPYFYINWGHRDDGINNDGTQNVLSNYDGWFQNFKNAHSGDYNYEKTLIINVKPKNKFSPTNIW